MHPISLLEPPFGNYATLSYTSNPFTIDKVKQRISMLQTLFTIADETEQVTNELLSLLGDYPTGGKQVHDANIVATMLTYGIKALLTHNIDDFRRFESRITIIPLVEEATQNQSNG